MEFNEEDKLNKLSFLLSASWNAIPSSNITLRSYFNIYLLRFAANNSLKLSKKLTSRNFNCPHCCIPWGPSTTSLKLVPSRKLKKHEKRKQVNEFLGSGKNPSKSVQLRNKLVLFCNVCRKSSPFSLKKKFLMRRNVDSKICDVKVIKKKKKKDKSCGLNPKFILTKKDTTPKNCNTSNENHKESFQDFKESEHNQIKKKFMSQLNKFSADKSIPKKESSSHFPNPYAVQIQNKSFKKNKKKLQLFQQALKEEKKKDAARKTLKDFLSLVS